MSAFHGSSGAASHEPPMYLQRPSSGRSQDVTHILARTFRELFTRDVISTETIRHLNVSRSGDDPYHERYVEALQKVNEERERRLNEATMLERHIMQAQARAMSADERELNRVSSGHKNYKELGLPPARSHFRACIDSQLLKKYGLLTPEDFATDKGPTVPPPLESDVPSYAKETRTSTLHRRSHDELLRLQEMGVSLRDSGATLHLSQDSEDLEPNALPRVQEQLPVLRSDIWKAQLNPEQREINKKDLENLQARANYLKNPRYIPPSAPEGGRTLTKPNKRKAKQIGIKPQPQKEKTKSDPSVVFIATPAVIQFTEYQVGQVYEITLDLKNITTSMRQCRVIPPKSSYFSIGLGMFPGEHGLVAPGISCKYAVRFIPDCLGDFEDELKVITQSSQPMTIKIISKRSPPLLTLPPTVAIGQCLVGGVRPAHVKILNRGGPGKFCLMPRSAWPTTSFKSMAKTGYVTVPPFEIRPSVFEARQGQSVLLEVLFTPQSVRKYTQHMTLVCDNCQVQHFTFTGEGQSVGVEISAADGGLSEPLPGEMCDIAAQHLLRFPNLNPFTYMQKTMTVRNTTNVALPYNWKIIKPHLVAPDSENSVDNIPHDRILDIDSSFSIDPQSGLLPPKGASDFQITFAPPEISTFHSVLHLILQEIPQSSGDGRPQTASSDFDDDVSEIAMTSEVATLHDVTALEVEVKGQSEPFKVLLQPYALHVPGKVLVGTSVRRQFYMTNNSISSIVFEWEKVCADFIIQVEPPMGELVSGDTMTLEMDLTSDIPGNIDYTLLCHVENLDEPLTLHVQAAIKGPEVVIDNADINFGLIRLGDTSRCEITVRNTCQISAKWWIQESPEYRRADTKYTFSPENGVLKPLESKTVTVTLHAQACASLRTIMDMYIMDGNESHIAARAEVQVPDVCLLSCQLDKDDAYIDVPVSHAITLYNKSLLETDYHWGKVEGDDASVCSAHVQPASGHLGPREELKLTLAFTAHRQGNITGVRLPCYVDGMAHPLCVTLTNNVKGLKVSYSTPPHDHDINSDDLILDLGSDVILGGNPKRFIHITNESAISAPYSLNVEEFSARPPSPPDQKFSGMPFKSQRKASMLTRTPNLADPLSKTAAKALADMCALMLTDGKGAAFVVQPASGVLQPFSEEVIEVMAFSDMWGSYTDRLVCKVETLDLVYVPIKMTVSGCPLQFQMASTPAGNKPMVRFGTHISGVETVRRNIRVNNPSPYDIRLDWQTMNIEPGDRQLLDAVVTFGEAFPLLDEDGKGIVPPVPPPVHPPRAPTDLILNSPDSSLPSRQMSQLLREPSATRPQFASVFIRQHEGVLSDQPFEISPRQLVIPAHGSSQVTVGLTPRCNTEVGRDCLGYCLGYLSLDPKKRDRRTSLPVGRVMCYEMEPLRLDMSAFIKPALLTIECMDDEGMRYRSAVSDLIKDDQIEDYDVRVCGAVLTNNTQTPLTFKLLTEQPFVLVNQAPSVSKLCQGTGYNTLSPQHNVQVNVGFLTSLSLLSNLHDLSPGSEHGGVSLDVGENGERKLHLRSSLTAEFNNGTRQTLPLEASLAVPQMLLSKESLDFGTCLVEQERELELLIFNKTTSGSYWTTTIEEQSSVCAADTFRLTPSSGTLDAHVTYVSRSKTLLKVFFKAKHAEPYEAVITFRGSLGEEPRKLNIRGQGSYDEKHEALVNV